MPVTVVAMVVISPPRIDSFEKGLKMNRAECCKRQKYPESEAKVADAIDDKCLLTGIGCALLLVPKADQQVGT